ncbi:tetratricopeptide repeat protein [Lentzea sp. NBC_00516]|uniref:AfsR/SARP family transcriptional regulator n=1 Tax=Lentzea sp. NBC_00516 TaxID=2903582 RepID=UPI002E7FB83D|nr:BTAD domain-containing putative transcriptional regulator [Lentzea sp. NBC_00516]WUD28917.1 tetratricopeptide repeat protein [Lentzea sp. NBC_00516]
MGNAASFEILGPLRVANSGQPLKPAGPRQRALLAALLVRAGRPISLDGLIDALWGENPPVSAVANIHTYVSRLRRDLTDIGLPGRLTTDSAGYRLRVEPDELDSELFEAVAAKAREALASGDAAKSVAFWQEAWALWRGPLLGDVPRAGWLEADVVRLDELLAAAREDSADARLAAGQYGALITELGVQVRQFPLREGLWWRLMRAQHQAGRRAEALETYRAVREVLVDALGVDPCEEIQDLHQEILRGGRPEAPGLNPVRPMQLPPDVDNFTGRDAELARLRKVLTRRSKSTLAAITGKAGVGKTSLAVRAAHESGDQFGGGQLYVRLGGTSSSPRDPATVLAELLIALGVHPHAVPEDVEARAALYRSQLAARSVLIVLDDAKSMAQVRPLLPGSESSAVLVTSRVQLVGAQTVNLDVLDAEEAVRLLGEIAGQDRMTAEPDAAAAVARYCGNLPLALRIAASRLARRGHWSVGRLAERLAGEGTRLNELRIDDLEARASLAWSYEALDDVQRRAFRLLGLLDVPDFPGWVLAALLDVGVHDAEEIVDGLADVHLLEVSGTDLAGQGRYRFHDLLRVFARERANEVDAPEERGSALRRAFTAWLDLAVQAESGLPCRFLKVRLDPERSGVEHRFADPLAWLEAERDALVGVVEQALKLGMTALACDLACSLTTLFDLRSHYDLWRHTHELALGAATEDRHRAILHQGLGALAFYRDHYGEANEHFTTAQEIFARIGEHRGHAYANLGLGSVHLFHGRQDEAAVRLGQAHETFGACADASGEAFALQAMGIVHRNQGRLDDAERCLGSALEIFSGLASRYGQACALFSLGLHHKARGDLARTEKALLDAIGLFRAASCPRDEALALHVLAATYAEQGDAGRASEMMSRSLTVFPQEDESVGKAATLYSLGWVAHRNQRPEEAAVCFEQALRLFDRLDLQVHVRRTVDALEQLGLTVPAR